MKLPSLKLQPVGQYAKGNIAQPNEAAKYDAIGNAIGAAGMAYATYRTAKTVNDIDEATGSAANELSELRAKLENSSTLPAGEIPDDILTELEVAVSDGVGGRKDITKPFVFTHEIADEMWEKGSQEIVDHYANGIVNPKARAKFIGEMTERYVAPGTGAIIKNNILRARAYGQAQAERTADEIASSNAPTAIRETQMRETFMRQVLLGADPVWAETQLAKIGPTIDQLDVQNEINVASSVDELDQIEDQMWSGATRMTPAQMRTLGTQADSKRADIKAARREGQTETADGMYAALYRDELTIQDVEAAVRNDGITNEDSQTMYNSLTKGSTTKASSPFTLSQYRGEIAKLQYTGGTGLRVRQKAQLLSLQVSRGAMGLTPQGMPTGQPAQISGVDALTLNKEIAAGVKASLENNEYDNARKALLAWTRSKLDIGGQITTAISGNQNFVDAAVQFKRGLDNYMDQFGFDAKPMEFFEVNKDAYDPRNFQAGINGSFWDQVPQSQQFMTENRAQGSNTDYEFDRTQQENFLLWLSDNATTIGPGRAAEISTLFNQYYRGQGRTPDSAMMLEPEDPLYHQFQQTIPDNE